MDIGTALSSELTRVIECPYPASLAGLADLLARTDIVTVRACIRDRPPCAVKKLATLIREALPLWADTFRILHSLSHSSEFRHELLHQNPGLLNALLTKANSSQQDFEDYAELCVLILSGPLPESVPLPAAAQSFFLRVFKKAIQESNADSLKSVYGMLNGACRQILALVPLDARQQFDEELSRMMSSNSAGQNFMLQLWCYGLVLHIEDIGDMQRLGPKQPISTESTKGKWKTSSGKGLFRLYNKLISLTCLNVVAVVKGVDGVPDDAAIEGIRIASKTLRFVDRKVRESWPRSSIKAGDTFQKLPEKLKHTAISQAVLLEALCFYAMVADKGELPHEIVVQYEQCLMKVAKFADPDGLGETLAVSLPVFAPHMQESTVRALLDGILESCVSAPSSQQLSNLIILVDEFSTGISASEPLRTKMLLALAADDLQGKLWNLVHAVMTREGASCSSYAVSLHGKLISATIALLLTTVLVEHTEKPTLPQALTIALINKQRQLPSVAHSCSRHPDMADRPSISLFQQECTPYTGQHLQDWRDRLKSELESQSFYQRDSIIRSVAQICQDLEARCNTVEEPLRREKERSKELERRVAALSEQISSLESQATDDRLHLDGLEDEKLNIADEKDQIATKLTELKFKFAEANQRANETLRVAQEEFDAKKLEFRSTILRHEESLSARDKEVEDLNGTLSQLKAAREKQEEDYRNLNEQHEHLQALLIDTQRILADERETAVRQTEDVTRLENRGFDLENQLQCAEAELEAVNGRLSDLQVSHEELIQSSEETLRELEVKHNDSMEAAALKVQEEHNELSAQLQSALQHNQRVKDAHDETQRELQRLQTSIPPLETRIHELTRFISEQKEELEELRTWRMRMFDAMGHTTKNPLAIRSASRSHTEANDSLTMRAPREHRRRKSTIRTQDVVPKVAMGTQANTTTEMMANTSFASYESRSESRSSQGGGPSPKRPKPRPSFKVPAMHTPHTQRPVLISRSVSKKLSPNKRLALRQMSPNRRHTTVGFAISEDEGEYHFNETRSARKRRGSLQDVEQEDFDMDDFLAGTPLTPGNFVAGTARVPEDDDGTTTEL